MDGFDARSVQLLTQTLSDNRICNMINFAAVTVVLYDIIICFSEERHFIWNAKWTKGKALYIGCRYVAPIYLVLGAIERTMTNCPVPVTRGLFYAQIWISICTTVPFQIVMCLRTYALYRGVKTVKWFITSMFTVQIILDFVMASIITNNTAFSHSATPGLPCPFSISETPRRAFLVLYVAALVLEFTMWFMSQIKLFPLVLTRKRSLALILFRDGTLYITAISLLVAKHTRRGIRVLISRSACSLCLSELLVFTLISESRSVLRQLFDPVMICLGSVLASRLILNLRAHDLDDEWEDSTYRGDGLVLHSRDGS